MYEIQLTQIHHIRTYCNSKVLWYVFILNCVYTGHNLMNCMVLYAQFRQLLYLVLSSIADTTDCVSEIMENIVGFANL